MTFSEIRVLPTFPIPFFYITAHATGQGRDSIYNLDVDLRGVDGAQFSSAITFRYAGTSLSIVVFPTS